MVKVKHFAGNLVGIELTYFNDVSHQLGSSAMRQLGNATAWQLGNFNPSRAIILYRQDQ